MTLVARQSRFDGEMGRFGPIELVVLQLAPLRLFLEFPTNARFVAGLHMEWFWGLIWVVLICLQVKVLFYTLNLKLWMEDL